VAEAEMCAQTALRKARGVRNGLMVALLALHPLRLRNFAALEIGRSFVEIRGSWWMVLAHGTTKSGRVDERRVPDILKHVVNSYLNEHRPVLGRSRSRSNALWLSSNDGAPMSYLGIERVVTDVTRLTLGVGVTPHLFRTSAASTAAIHAGNMPQLASAILQHTDARVTEEHYNRATSMSAAGVYAEIIRGYLREEEGPCHHIVSRDD